MTANALETVYNITDTFFLGKLGSAEVSAPPIAMNILFFLMVFGIGLAGAGTTLIAQSRGRECREKMNFYLAQMFFFVGITSLLILITGFIFAGPLLSLIRTPDDIFPHALGYLKIMFLGIPFMFGFFSFQSAMQGVGNTVLPLKIQLFTVSLNILLDWLLIFGYGPVPSFGVEGAALATVLARFVAMVAGCWFLVKGKHGIQLKAGNMVPEYKSLRLFFQIGIPSSFGQALSALGFTILQGIVNSFGTPVIAAFGICNRINSLFFMPAMGLSRAVTSLVGRNLGAKEIERAREIVASGVKIVLIYIIPSMTLTFFFGGSVMRFFVEDAETIWWGKVCFRMISPSVLFFTIFIIYTGAFNGAGSTRAVMILNIIRLWVFRLPLAYLLGTLFGMGPQGLYVSMVISNIGVALLGFLWYYSGRWVDALDPDSI